VDELSRHFPLAGNIGEVISRVKDPETFAHDCETIGIPHPVVQRDKPFDPKNWVMKIAGAAGGTHVRTASTCESPKGNYYQRRLSGTAVSCLFIASPNGAQLVGFSRQWQSPIAGAPYRYGGAVRLARFPTKDKAMIGRWLDGLVERIGLRGLCSADFIRSISGYYLLEINPRPGATLDIFDTTPTPLFEAHIRACRGGDVSLARARGSVASMIAYADRALASLPSFQWPQWSADHQPAGSTLDAGDPVCTVFGSGPNAAIARQNMRANARLLEHNWLGNRP
jgi:predicted ATP-grasp superfamily ATP-dependent carboligase